MDQETQLKIRLPLDVKDFVAAEAEKNGCSRNSEIIRSIRERMDRARHFKVAPASTEAVSATVRPAA